ncbi:MAG: endonuclease V [Candidatus Latescibacterota bacterium]
MKTISPFHTFSVSLEEARRIQNEMGGQVELADSFVSIDQVELVGGADVAFLNLPSDASKPPAAIIPGEGARGTSRFSKAIGPEAGVLALAVAVTMEPNGFRVVETAYAIAPVLFPYIPGLLTFREGPAVLAAIGELTTLPGVMLYDGTGIAHPRGMGIAAHMALLTGIPSIGCAKSILVGKCADPGVEKGSRSYLYYRNRVVGACLRTRRGVKPMYVSPGSGFSVDGACSFVLSLTGKYRLPEPTRLAHNLVTAKKLQLTRKEGEINGMHGARGW